jgi:hypothetical protein
MPATVEELEKRVAALEHEVTALRQLLQPRPIGESPAERGARLLRTAQQQQGQFAAAFVEVLEKMGIRGEPVGVERLREMMVAAGIRPEDNAFSRGIIEMREE